jgi:hypothetical protein
MPGQERNNATNKDNIGIRIVAVGRRLSKGNRIFSILLDAAELLKRAGRNRIK